MHELSTLDPVRLAVPHAGAIYRGPSFLHPLRGRRRSKSFFACRLPLEGTLSSRFSVACISMSRLGHHRVKLGTLYFGRELASGCTPGHGRRVLGSFNVQRLDPVRSVSQGTIASYCLLQESYSGPRQAPRAVHRNGERTGVCFLQLEYGVPELWWLERQAWGRGAPLCNTSKRSEMIHARSPDAVSPA